MAYFTLALIKKNLEILPSDTSLDATLNDYGAESDAWVDNRLGLSSALSPVPTIITHASSTYAAGRYLARVKEVERSRLLVEVAEKQIMEYNLTQNRAVVVKSSAYRSSPLKDE